MAGEECTQTQPSEKDRLRIHYNQELERDLPPTPNSVTLGSPISPLDINTPRSLSIVNSSTSTQADANYADNHHQIATSATPPPYSGPSSTVQLAVSTPTPPSTFSQSPQRHHGLPPLNYGLYSPPLFELSSDCTSLKSTAPYLSASVSALVNMVRTQSTVPPKPQIHITGGGGHRPDFALKLNLMHLLVPDDSTKARMDYIRTVAPGEMALRGGMKPSVKPDLGDAAGLEDWARRFVEDTSPVKAFVLKRTVVNMDTDWLEGQVRSLIASMGYKGTVSVKFPITHTKVIVQNPDRVNKFFTGLTTLFTGKSTYEVAQAVWPFASCRRDEPGLQSGQRVFAVQSEEQWWREWAQPLRYAIATRRHGWVTVEDKLEAIMEGKGKGITWVDYYDSGV